MSGFRERQRHVMSVLHSVQTGFGAHQPSAHGRLGLVEGIKRPEHYARLSSVEIKNLRNSVSIPYTY
jgi:hypothetical protein